MIKSLPFYLYYVIKIGGKIGKSDLGVVFEDKKLRRLKDIRNKNCFN